MSTIAKSASVVFATLVGVPEIDERARKRAAGASENLSAQFDQPRLAVRLDEIGALGRVIRRARRGACPSWKGVMQADGVAALLVKLLCFLVACPRGTCYSAPT